MSKSKSGFTIVELLIVIVVIAILAAISVVAYRGVQTRARNSARVQDVASIQKALELFRVEHGRYPYSTGPGAANLPPDFTAPYSTTGYSYSIATNDSWLQELRASGLIGTVPKDPINNNTNYYVYYASPSIGSCTEPVYALIVRGWEGGAATMPSNARALNCSITGVITASWPSNNHAVFSNLNKPLPD